MSTLVVAMKYHESGSFADPNSRIHKPELRRYACLIYKQQVILLLSYLTVDKTVSAGLNEKTHAATDQSCH